MIKVLLVLHVFVTIALIGVVLIQRSEGGGLGLGGAQGMGSFMSGRGTANLLTRTTAILGTLFFVLSLALACCTRAARPTATPPSSTSRRRAPRPCLPPPLRRFRRPRRCPARCRKPRLTRCPHPPRRPRLRAARSKRAPPLPFSRRLV